MEMKAVIVSAVAGTIVAMVVYSIFVAHDRAAWAEEKELVAAHAAYKAQVKYYLGCVQTMTEDAAQAAASSEREAATYMAADAAYMANLAAARLGVADRPARWPPPTRSGCSGPPPVP